MRKSKTTAIFVCFSLAIALLMAGCKQEHNDSPVIWIGNADISDDNDVVADFSNAFASEPLCHGIRIETHDFPEKSHWFLETYSANGPNGGPHEFSDGISWWMVRNDGNKDTARFDGSDASSIKAAYHVCFIIKGKGGDVH